MKHTNTKHEQESDSKNSFNTSIATKPNKLMKRVLFMIIATFMVFAGAQSTPITQASAPCEMVCSEYIDPNDGQCYILCCPRDEICKMPCERKPCK
jgi:hypothetical protein